MLNFCCKLAVLYHGTAMVIVPLLKRAFGRNLNMRRKVKQLLATGMALAVLATNLMPVSLAAETAEELQTGEVATQALTDEIAARTFYHKNHIYTEPIRNGFELVNSETGEARPYVVVGCTNLIGSCDQKEATYYGKIVSPSGTTNATCTSDKVFSYSATWIANSGIWFVDAADITVPNSKANHKFTNYVKKTEATCTKDATEIASCDYGCGKTDIRDIEGTKLEHNFDGAEPSKWEWSTDYTTVTVTLPCQNGNPECTATKTDVTDEVSYSATSSTCKKPGVATYTATYNGYTDVKTKELPLAKHTYSGEPSWTWNADHTKATATFKCDVCGETAESTGIYGSIEETTVKPTCTKEGSTTYSTYVIDNGKVYKTEDVVTIPKVAHDCSLVLEWKDDTYTAATAKVKCDNCGYERVVDAEVTSETTEPTCTKDGYINHLAKASADFTEGLEDGTLTNDYKVISGQTILPALGHSFTNYVYNGDATCDGDGTETAKCDRCDVTDTRTAVATAGCDLHTVDGAKVCAVCGKVNGQPKLAAAEANADVNASTIGAHLVVRVGTLPTGQKVITVAFLNNDGQAVQMFGTQKIHVSLAQLKAALGDTEGTGFEHTLTRVNTANGEKQNVGFTVENGTVNFDAAFNGSTACILLVD